MTTPHDTKTPGMGPAAEMPYIEPRPTGVDICMCTFRRPEISEALASIFAQKVPSHVTLSLIVADNDVEPSAKARIMEAHAVEGRPVPLRYIHAPARNISLARNACLDAATGDWVAFLDDDETADPGWISALLKAAEGNALDVIFGPAIAVYPDDAPDWIRDADYHTNRAPQHDGSVSTGHTCNVLMRWADSPIRDQRFLLEKGRTGGEDVEFFFRLSRLGLKLGICDEARVFERTVPARLTFDWLRTRHFSEGQFHGAHSDEAVRGTASRLRLAGLAAMKAAYCFARATLLLPIPVHRRAWRLRAWFHTGVTAAALGMRQAERY